MTVTVVRRKGLILKYIFQIGGVASGFTHVEINEVEDRKVLTRVKGKRPVRATQVPIKWTSLTDSDSYVFDIGKVRFSKKYSKSPVYECPMARNILWYNATYECPNSRTDLPKAKYLLKIVQTRLRGDLLYFHKNSLSISLPLYTIWPFLLHLFLPGSGFHCFTLKLWQEIYVWSGPKASHFEKNKAIQYADGLKNERQGRAELHHIDSLDDKESRTMVLCNLSHFQQ